MIYITGDTHASHRKWAEQLAPSLSSGDILIVLGDFGIGFWDSCCHSEKQIFDSISEQNYIVLFIDGNHENFDRLYALPVEYWNGGRVHRIRHNLIHLMRGEIYQLDGLTVFCLGGGNSIDRYMRRDHETWWAQEMPSEEEYRNAEENLKGAGWKVDYILTHTAPSESVYYLSTIRSTGIKNIVPEELPLTTFLDKVQEKTDYRHWYFGHFHVDIELWRNQTAVFNTLRALKSGDIVRCWDSYEG